MPESLRRRKNLISPTACTFYKQVKNNIESCIFAIFLCQHTQKYHDNKLKNMGILEDDLNLQNKTTDLLVFSILGYIFYTCWDMFSLIQSECQFLFLCLLFGICKLTLKAFKLIKFLVVTLQGWIFPIDLKKYGGEYALITGGSDGIGKAYAKNFAARGINLILVARNLKKLELVKQELLSLNQAKYPNLKIQVIQIDFSDPTDAIYQKLEQEITKNKYEIGILVNNVGIGYPYPCKLNDIPEDEFHTLVNNLLNVNCRAQIKVTRIVLKQMNQRNNGLIINLSSLSAKVIVPMGTVYGAAKTFNQYFSEGLRYELMNSKNITIQTVTPFWIATNLVNGLLQESLFIPSPERFVNSAVSTIGYQDRTFGYVPHEIMGFLCSLNPHRIAANTVQAGRRKQRDYKQRQ